MRYLILFNPFTVIETAESVLSTVAVDGLSPLAHDAAAYSNLDIVASENSRLMGKFYTATDHHHTHTTAVVLYDIKIGFRK